MMIVSQHVRDILPMVLVSAGKKFLIVEWGSIDVAETLLPPPSSVLRGDYEKNPEVVGVAYQ